MPGSQLQYRLYTDQDLPGVLDLWEKHSGWGGISQEDFNTWYLNTPYGSCIIIVAVNETGQIVGQKIFIPSLIQIKDKQVKALRISAPILHENFRQTAITRANHPAYSMLRSGIEAAIHQGYKIVYLYPALGWVTPMRLCHSFNLPRIDIATFDCFGISLNDPATLYPLSDDLVVTELKIDFHNDHNELWNEAVHNFPISCGVVRNTKWLNWKSGGHLVLEVRNAQSQLLKGYLCLNKQSGLVVDMLARTEQDAGKILKSVIHSVHHLNPQRIPIPSNEINGMYTATFQSLLKNIKYGFKKFRFAFGCFPLDISICDEDIKPSNWYMMPND